MRRRRRGGGHGGDDVDEEEQVMEEDNDDGDESDGDVNALFIRLVDFPCSKKLSIISRSNPNRIIGTCL